jgi:hypothetical protein
MTRDEFNRYINENFTCSVYNCNHCKHLSGCGYDGFEISDEAWDKLTNSIRYQETKYKCDYEKCSLTMGRYYQLELPDHTMLKFCSLTHLKLWKEENNYES